MRHSAQYPSIAAVGTKIGPQIERHMDLAFRAGMHGPQVASGPRFVRLVTGEPHPLGNFALLTELEDVACTRAAIEPLVACGAPAAVLHTGTAGREVDECVRGEGFAPHDGMPAMAVDIARLPETTLPRGYEFVRVRGRDEDDAAAWVEAFAAGYELPLAVAKAFEPRGSDWPDEPMQFFAVRKGAKTAGTSVMYLADGLAGVYCVATVPDERGRGLGAYATAEPLRGARKLGYGVGVLQSSAAGYPVYRRLGFEDFGAVSLYIRVPA